MTAPEDILWNRLNDAFSECSEAELARELEQADRAMALAPDEPLNDLEIEASILAVRERVALEPIPVSAQEPRRRPWVAAAALLVLLIGGWWLLRGDDSVQSRKPLDLPVAWIEQSGGRPIEYRARQVIAELDEGISVESLEERYGLRLLAAAPVSRTYLFEHDSGTDIESLLTGLQNDRDVLWAEPNYVVRAEPVVADAHWTAEIPSPRKDDSLVRVSWVGSAPGSRDAEDARRVIRELSPDAELSFESVVDERGIGDAFGLVMGLHQAWTQGAKIVQLGVRLEAPSELLTQAVRSPVNAGLLVIAPGAMFTRDVGSACPQACDLLELAECDESTGAPLVRTPNGSGTRLGSLAGYAAHAFAVDPQRDPRDVATCLREELQKNPNCLVPDRIEGDLSNLVCMDS
ncbi:MAG: hypothetical protein RL885_30070 [Planctomycetota bacterium]